MAPAFNPGWFSAYGPMSPSQRSLTIDGVAPNIVYFYRVNTLYSYGWNVSAAGYFVSTCSGPPVLGAVTQTCEGDGTVTVTFNWWANAPGTEWLDLSIYNNGFAGGTFVSGGPFWPGTNAITWRGIARGVWYYWRVNTLTRWGWPTSDTGWFASLTCRPATVACVGYMAGYSSSGLAECQQLASGPDRDLGDCIGYIIGVPGIIDGKGACVRYALGNHDAFLEDCLLGLTGQSYFGYTSCRLYYQAG